MDEFVQVEDPNQEERAAVLESTIIAEDDENIPTTMVVREDATNVLQETVRPVTTDMEPVPGVKVDKILQFLLDEIKCFKEDVHSNITGAVTDLASLKEDMKSLKMMMEGTFANVAVVKEDANTAGDEKNETGVEIPESDSMRRINVLATNSKALRVLMNQDFFQNYCFGDVRKYDIGLYIMSALEAFQRGEGTELPTNVLRWPFQSLRPSKPDQLILELRSDEIEVKCLQFQNMVVSHLNLLVGSKPRIEKDAEGKLMMFYE
jgi:hypothetical protein